MNVRSNGAPKAKKDRYIAGVVTPQQPNYLDNLVDKEDAGFELEYTPPTLGVAMGVSGFKVRPISPALHRLLACLMRNLYRCSLFHLEGWIAMRASCSADH